MRWNEALPAVFDGLLYGPYHRSSSLQMPFSWHDASDCGIPKALYMFELANPGARSDLKCRPWRHTSVLRSQSFRGAMGPN